MKICSDPLGTVRYTAPKQQWCSISPDHYQTNIPFASNQIDCVGQRRSNNATIYSNKHNHPCIQNIDSSIPKRSLLIERLQQKVDLSQTPTSEETAQMLQRLTAIVQQHVPDFILRDTNIPNHLSSSKINASSVGKSNSVGSFTGSINSADSLSQVMSISVPHKSHRSKQQSRASSSLWNAVKNVFKSGDRQSNTSLHSKKQHPGSSHSLNSAKVKTGGFTSPATGLRPEDSSSSAKSLVSAENFQQSPKWNTAHEENTKNPLQQSATTQTSAYTKEIQSNWFRRLLEKFSRKQQLTTPFQNSSSQINQDQLQMKEALTTFEQDLAKEVFQTLIDKSKDDQQQGLMYFLTTPSRCCRSCRTKRRLASAALHSMDIALRNLPP